MSYQWLPARYQDHLNRMLSMPDLATFFRGSSLCVVGNVNRDIKTSPFPATDQVLLDGESSVETIIETIGGGGANSACIAAALGATTLFVGKVGADSLGQRLERTLSRQGVRTHLALDRRGPTGTSLALNYVNGQRHFVSSLPASQSFQFDDIDLTALNATEHLLRADIWFSTEMLFGGNERLLRHARDKGLSTSIDLNWDPHWGFDTAQNVRERKRAVRAVLPWVNLVHGNTRELIEFSEAASLEDALPRLTEWGAEGVVVHLGAQGAGYDSGGTLVREPAVQVRQQLCSVGTGDVLSVGMMLLHRCTEVSVPTRLRLMNGIVAEYIEGRRAFIPVLGE